MVSSRLFLSITALLFGESATAAVLRQRDCGFVWPAQSGDTCNSLAAAWVSTQISLLIGDAVTDLAPALVGYYGGPVHPMEPQREV